MKTGPHLDPFLNLECEIQVTYTTTHTYDTILL